jgi:hypothetical protein
MIKNKLLTFSDLKFQPHAHVSDGIMAKLNLGNDFEVSVVSMLDKDGSFGSLYGNASKGTYEVAMFYKNDMIPLGLHDDVLGWQSKDQVTKHMADAQQNGVAWLDLLQKLRKDARDELGLDN